MRRRWVIGLLALLAPLGSAVAGDLYVPLAANTALGAFTYRTLLILTNTGTTSADLTVTFHPGGSDGAVPPPATPYSLPPGATLRLYNDVPAGARGMFALSGDPSVVVSARIEALGANGGVLASTQVPVLSATNAIAAGRSARLLGLEQAAAGAVSDFGLINLSTNPAQCTVDAFRSNGGRIGSTIHLSLLPRSNRDFAAALAILGQTAIKDARFDVSCDQLFATYALVYRSGGPETVILDPAASLETELVPVNDGGVLFTKPGLFANGDEATAFDLPLQNGVRYGKARIEFDLLIDRWRLPHPDNPNFKNVMSLRRPANLRLERVLYCGLILKGSVDYRTILDMGLPFPGAPDGTTIKSGKGPWKERSTYHLVLDYDTVAKRVLFEVYQNGTRIQKLEGPVNATDLSNLPGKNVRVDFSSPGVGDGAYFPTYGWKYSNLVVKLTPLGRGRS